MAGIGFTMRHLMGKGTIGGVLQAVSLASMICTGPWVLSIVAILAIGLIGAGTRGADLFVTQFQVSVTYLMVGSLILTSALQLTFTRFIADRLYEQAHDKLLGNLLGALVLIMLCAAVVGGATLLLYRPGSFVYQQCMLAGFVLLCGTWIMVSYATAVRAHGSILVGFFLGYAATVGAALALAPLGLDGLMVGFVIGQAVLFFILLSVAIRRTRGNVLLSFAFLHKGKRYVSLVATGLLYSLGVWADKFIFWADAGTGVTVIAPLQASPIYDLPIFLAYLSLVPGMAVLFYRIESDFSPTCEAFYATIRAGAPLAQIRDAKQKMVVSIRGCLLALLKVQGVTTLLLFLIGDDLLDWFRISQAHRSLLNINLLSAALQLLLLMIFNVLFYLDKRRSVLQLATLLALSNVVFSLITLRLGPAFYGYGFATSMMLTSGLGMLVLSYTVERLEYATFMLQAPS